MRQYPIFQALSSPTVINKWSCKEWRDFIQQVYVTGLTGRFYHLFKIHDVLVNIPPDLLWHFESAYQCYLAHKQDIENEAKKINSSLTVLGIEPIYLKGAAYVISNDNVSFGRVFSDVDILIEKDKLASSEQMLHWSGWVPQEESQYDDSYYREWMHEIPPMTNSMSGIALDIHHTLVPIISKQTFDVSKFLENSCSADDGNLLAPFDRILHSALHLFSESEFDKGLRDLSDLDMLIKQYCCSEQDFVDLIARAEEMQLGRILYYCFNLTKQMLDTPVPIQAIKEVDKFAPVMGKSLMVTLLSLSILPEHRTMKVKWSKAAKLLMFIRGHLVRMPLHILIPHWLHKAFITPFEKKQSSQ